MKRIFLYVLVFFSLFLVIGCKQQNEPNSIDDGATTPAISNKIDVTNVIFKDAKFTYDGKVHSLAVENLPEGVMVTYLQNNQRAAKEYDVTAILTDKATGAELKRLTAKLTIEASGGGTVDPKPTNPPVITAEYQVVINGTTKIDLIKNNSALNPSFTEYYALGVDLSVGDVITLYNVSTGDTWAIQTPDTYSEGNFIGGKEGITCNEAGKFDIYVKLKYENDQIYFKKSA